MTNKPNHPWWSRGVPLKIDWNVINEEENTIANGPLCDADFQMVHPRDARIGPVECLPACRSNIEIARAKREGRYEEDREPC